MLGREVRTAEPLVPGPSRLEVDSVHIPAELTQAGGEILLSATHKLIYLVWNKEEFPGRRKESIIVPVHKKGDKTDCYN
jgi:hypothetical protein